MRLTAPALIALAVTAQAAARAFHNELTARTGSTDVCAEVDAGLSVKILGISIVIGLIGMSSHEKLWFVH